ncbi:4-methyl-5(b-hydroxyethyl)-thiazole monophosphate biosynthesis protein [Spiroplasma gladiatoris]|uniref:4-methyl-5(B-hydroxyethyl)-thiazole monophosphate biosynthesis protein n=1 Tax=Spiroplasma gladiatoris TaxID=2143 RepID=A0A4P7AHC0_9MOLU|nr:DJ-1 family glyoxalase III [Spiroplasma gladiatoris]QBQ07577.1 4-methyl-5(b-hydroxyethyl)-thiazole monophosphate biosynthesis protein [Spiroplasma gladiatoris]
MANVAVFLATGYEETEMIATVDVIRRAEQMFPNSFPIVDIVSISDKNEVVGSHGISIRADKTIQEIDFNNYDCLILPGGQPGVDNLMESETLMKNLVEHAKKEKTLAAICAAPQILGKLGLVDNKEVTHYPGCDKYLQKAILKPHISAIEDGNIITGSSIGAALQFGLQIVDHFTSTEQMLQLHQSLVFNY